ncbi:hypothetical protein Uis1B_1996 [Bifidobacterium margollesii]|uniref:Uncharacterized protein n=1 Tax=Bifidobacterium margollesii TaxID=2020964 RepID=A0A2N5J7J5_9BIFI|nr:hypothetical protein [Bifidobacterium margollesii]PLS30174.1 hypothetical protein Uis1B_1996 [Bifidobacterium margollesii]
MEMSPSVEGTLTVMGLAVSAIVLVGLALLALLAVCLVLIVVGWVVSLIVSPWRSLAVVVQKAAGLAFLFSAGRLGLDRLGIVPAAAGGTGRLWLVMGACLLAAVAASAFISFVDR